MKRLLVVFLFLLLYGSVEGEAALYRNLSMECSNGKEIWRKVLGENRCLLLYKDEKGELQMHFSDGPWLCMTEELVERVEGAGWRLWEKESGENKGEKNQKRC